MGVPSLRSAPALASPRDVSAAGDVGIIACAECQLLRIAMYYVKVIYTRVIA